MVWVPPTNKDISNQFKDVPQDLFFNNYSTISSVTEMWLNWKPLVHYRNQLKAIIMFKIIHNLIDIPANTHLIPLSSDHISRGHQWKFKQPMTRTRQMLKHDGASLSGAILDCEWVYCMVTCKQLELQTPESLVLIQGKHSKQTLHKEFCKVTKLVWNSRILWTTSGSSTATFVNWDGLSIREVNKMIISTPVV